MRAGGLYLWILLSIACPPLIIEHERKDRTQRQHLREAQNKGPQWHRGSTLARVDCGVRRQGWLLHACSQTWPGLATQGRTVP